MLGGVQEKLPPTPEVFTLMISGMVAVGVFLKARMDMLARFAAEIFRMFCVPAVSVI